MPGLIEWKNAEFLVDTTARLLNSMEKALKVPYALGKMDLLMVPEDFEHSGPKWGEMLYYR